MIRAEARVSRWWVRAENPDEAFAAKVAVTTRQVALVATVGRVGPPGQRGEPGPAGPPGEGEGIALVAGEILGGHKAIWLAPDGLAYLASASNPEAVGRVLGVTTGAVLQGESVAVRNAGAVAGAGLPPGLTLWLGEEGALVPSPPTSGLHQQIALSQPDGSIQVALGPPILRP